MTTTVGDRSGLLPAVRYHTESFTPEETAILERFFTNTTEPVFGLVNLPEVVKGALFARYSRSPKSVRRLFLDEFYDAPEVGIASIADHLAGDDDRVDMQRAEDLYNRVFTQYGDDSVAQLGGVHLACEQASNILTKVLERGRLAAYLEQSTRYMFYDQRLGDRYRYVIPPEVAASTLAREYEATMEHLFDLYAGLTARLTAYYESLHPQSADDSNFVYRSTIRARVCDDLRGLLPAATLSNVGIYATGQAYEMLLLRMRASALAEVRDVADRMLVELRKLIPAFLVRVDMAERGEAWSRYLADTAAAMRSEAAGHDEPVPARPEVTLVEWDPDADAKVAAAALYAYTDLPDDHLLEKARSMTPEERARILSTYVGERGNRRHKPGRAMERASYRFDILCDYGIFRDLQRHRMMTLEWQRLGTKHGYVLPESVADIGAEEQWRDAMDRAAAVHGDIDRVLGPDAAQYAVPFGYRIRFYMDMNAREAFHMLELRTAQGGHPDYRRVCQEMHRLIRDVAGHAGIAAAMRFVDHDDYGLGRLATERRAAAKRAAAGVADPED
ncbi:MAG TPA: FAD-dependent thymidylate synthase [Acidimicrobiia bacterium]|nr:FAD-dependent thymidylate synthase [Acidimicrobiia bacterium]